MYGSRAATKQHPSRMFETGAFDAGAQDKGAALAFDMTKVADGSAVDAKGQLIENDMSIATYLRSPTTALHRFYAGITENAVVDDAYERYITWGPCEALVHNPDSGASLTLPVGTLLDWVPGQIYLEPDIARNAAGAANILQNRCAFAKGFIRKAITLTAGQSTLAQVYLYPPRPPQPFELRYFSAAAPATFAGMVLGITRGAGWIDAVNVGVLTGGNAGDLNFDVLINGTTIYTTAPVIVNDCVDPFNSLIDTAAPGSGTGPGTAGSYGLINSAANTFAKRSRIGLTITNDSSFVGTGVNVVIQGYYI